MFLKEHVPGGRRHSRRGSLKPGLIGAAALAALVAAIAVPAVFANAGDPDSTQASWVYTNGDPSQGVDVTVTGTWSWGTNPSGGKDSQSCWSGNKPEKSAAGYDDVNGHAAVGIAVSWNDSSTPNTLTGKNTSGQPVTLHVGDTMDWVNPNYCAGTSASNPYPSGTFSATHHYPSLAAYNAAVPNGGMCVNAYDVHKYPDANEENPSKNGDNTLHNGHYSLGVDCATAVDNNPPAQSNPAMTVIKYERIGSASYTRGPITGNVGDRVDYEMVVQDTGNTDLSVTLSDPHCDAGTITPSGAVTLHPGDSATYFCSHVLVAGDRPTFTNTATANAGVLNASSQTTGNISASSSVDTNINPPSTPTPPPAQPTPPPAQPGTPPPADLNIVKLERIGATGGFVQGPIAGHVGDTVFYEILVTNPSSDPYTLNVTLSDPRCDANTLAPSAVVTLAPGQEQTYTCSHVLVAGDQPQFTNTATATAGPLNASASVQGVTRSASAVANVGPAAQVKGVTKTITKKAKPAPKKAVVKAASFTG
jgi:hypothetical protein